MNYLAHAYLSFHQPEILVGNMISDFVKGKKKFAYASSIQKGIMLHRAIDEFTDFHPATSRAKQFFRPVYRLYSAVFTDVMYDHFLAKDINQFSDDNSLLTFSTETYEVLSSYKNILPENFSRMLPFMISHNWLYNYQFNSGIKRSFEGLARRAKYIDESEKAFGIFENNYAALKECYEEFFPQVRAFAYKQVMIND